MAEPDRSESPSGMALSVSGTRSSNRLHQLRGPDSQPVTLAAWASRGGLIAIGRFDGTVTVWPLPGRRRPGEPNGSGRSCCRLVEEGRVIFLPGWAGALACWSRRLDTAVHTNIGGDPGSRRWPGPTTALGWRLGACAGGCFQFLEGWPGCRLRVSILVASISWHGRRGTPCLCWLGGGTVSACWARLEAFRCTAERRRTNEARQSLHGMRMGNAPASADSTVLSRLVGGGVQDCVAGAVRSGSCPGVVADGASSGGRARWWGRTDLARNGSAWPAPIFAHQTNVVSVGLVFAPKDISQRAGSDGAVAVWAPFEDSGVLLSAIPDTWADDRPLLAGWPKRGDG